MVGDTLLVGRTDRLGRLDAGDVKATTGDGSSGVLVGDLAQSTQGRGTRSGHCDVEGWEYTKLGRVGR
jgi:hypothetical protein